MISTNLSQVWQRVEQLNPQEQMHLLQMLLQTFQQRVSEQSALGAEKETIRGKYAFVPTSSEAFAQRKAEELILE